jgi:lambda family phage portal protein
VENTLNFGSMTTQIFRGAMMNGDGLGIPLWMPSPRTPFATKIQLVESDRLSNPLGLIDSQYLRGGIKINNYGKPVSYWVRKAHPGDVYLGFIPDSTLWEEIPAETAWGRRRVIHVHDKERTGQHRGKPILTSVLTQFKMADHYQRSEMQAAVVNAMVAAFIETPMDSEAILQMLGGETTCQAFADHMDKRLGYVPKLQGGAVVPLYPGDKMSSFAPARPAAQFGPFLDIVFRHIGVALGLPLELLLKDFSRLNYSASRAMLAEAWRFFMGRRQWLTDYWCKPVYELVIEEAINAGMLDAPDFYTHRAAYLHTRWIGPGRGWLDPLKEMQACELRMQNYVSTLEDECAEQGRDWVEVLQQRAAERAMMVELNLPLPEVLSSRQPEQVQQAEEQEEDGADAPEEQAANQLEQAA